MQYGRPRKTVDPQRLVRAVLALKRRLYDRPFEPQGFIDGLCAVYQKVNDAADRRDGDPAPIQTMYLAYTLSFAYRWDAATVRTAAFIQQVCDTQQRMGLLPEVRLCIKQRIRYLDRVEQEGTLEGVDVTDQIVTVQHEIAQAKGAQAPPSWDA